MAIRETACGRALAAALPALLLILLSSPVRCTDGHESTQ